MNNIQKDKMLKEKPSNIKGTFDDVLKVSVSKPKKKDKEQDKDE